MLPTVGNRPIPCIPPFATGQAATVTPLVLAAACHDHGASEQGDVPIRPPMATGRGAYHLYNTMGTGGSQCRRAPSMPYPGCCDSKPVRTMWMLCVSRCNHGCSNGCQAD